MEYTAVQCIAFMFYEARVSAAHNFVIAACSFLVLVLKRKVYHRCINLHYSSKQVRAYRNNKLSDFGYTESKLNLGDSGLLGNALSTDCCVLILVCCMACEHS